MSNRIINWNTLEKGWTIIIKEFKKSKKKIIKKVMKKRWRKDEMKARVKLEAQKIGEEEWTYEEKISNRKIERNYRNMVMVESKRNPVIKNVKRESKKGKNEKEMQIEINKEERENWKYKCQ